MYRQLKNIEGVFFFASSCPACTMRSDCSLGPFILKYQHGGPSLRTGPFSHADVDGR